MTRDPRRGYFVSDLHLFARRSTAFERMPEILETVANAHTFVLGGDIFDFKWSTHSSFDQSLDMAARWLSDLVSKNAHCEFHFILGNHDASPHFVARLESLAAEAPHFSWHRYFVRLDHCLFLHGDIADGEPDHERLDSRRKKLDKATTRGNSWHVLYDLAVQARLHRLAITAAVREAVVLERVLAYANHIGHGPESGVQDTYFGHTHQELDGVEYCGLRFHNGGAAIKGLRFRIVETTLAGKKRRNDQQIDIRIAD